MVCYTGEELTWERAMSSQLNFALPEYSWDAQAPVTPNADGTYRAPLPGVDKFV
jgi:hypothetical protein